LRIKIFQIGVVLFSKQNLFPLVVILTVIKHLNIKAMGNLLYVIAVILVIIWAISFLGGYYTGGIIHALLVIAVIAILLRLVRSAA